MFYPFGRIKLRSTGRASNLTSPTTDFSPENPKSFQADVKAVKLDPNDALWLIVTTVEGGEAPNRRRLSPHRSQEEEKAKWRPWGLRSSCYPRALFIQELGRKFHFWLHWSWLHHPWQVWYWSLRVWRKNTFTGLPCEVDEDDIDLQNIEDPVDPKNVSAKHKVNNCCS